MVTNTENLIREAEEALSNAEEQAFFCSQEAERWAFFVSAWQDRLTELNEQWYAEKSAA